MLVIDHYVVIGAGILGASTAYHLAKKGVKVWLIDRQDAGQATAAAAGIVCPWLSQRRNKAWYRLAIKGARYYPALMKELEALKETVTGYEQVGAISLHIDEQKLDKKEELAYKRLEEAPEIGKITRLSPRETQHLFPLLREDYFAIHISGAARVNGRALRDSLIQAAKKLGATMIKGNAALLYHSNRITGVLVDGERLSADKVIVTAGAWAREVLQPLGVNFLVTPQKAQIVHLQHSDLTTDQWPVVMPPNNQYILAFEHGHIVIGATHEDEVGFDHRVTAGGLHEVLDKALAIAPGLANSTVVETRVGFRPFTPGFLPVIGELPSYSGLYLANGLGASGLTVGPYLGSELAKLAIGEGTELDLADYSISGALDS